MRNINQKKVNKERGAATIEAIISFTGFLFVIFTILGVINICRAQMLISNAVDTATKELTQYSYFYKMSGLQKFSEELTASAESGKTILNDVIGTVDQLYSSIGTAVDNTAEHATNVKNAVEQGDVDVEGVQNALANIQSDGTNIMTSMNSVSSAFSTVKDNPLLYMKSLVAIAGNEGLDLIKSHIIAAPLAKLFVSKHFGKTTTEADKYLENLGVVDGLDGMNFNMSTIFASDSPEDIHIIVYYKIKVVQIFNWGSIEIPMCKESVARAWLAGDDVQKKVKPAPSLTPTPTLLPEGTPTPEGASPTPTAVPQSTGLWALSYSEREKEADKLLDDQYGLIDHEELGMVHYNPEEEEPVAYDSYVDTDVEGCYFYGVPVSYTDPITGEVFYNAAVCSMTAQMKILMQLTYNTLDIKKSDGETPVDFSGCEIVIYVPENISDEQYDNVLDSSTQAYFYMHQYLANNTEGIPSDIYFNFRVEKAGGNYYDASKQTETVE